MQTSLLMSSIRSLPFPLCILLLPDWATIPNHHAGLILNNQEPKSLSKRYDGPIYLPPQIFKLLIQDAMKTSKAFDTEAINRFHQRKVHHTEVVECPQDDPPDPSVPDCGLSGLPESDLAIPDDPILNSVNSQCHSSEDLDQALQAYQAYQVPCSQDSTPILERSINHHYTYYVAQDSQAKHDSL